MHEFISFIATLILSPSNLIIVLLIASFIIRKPFLKRACRIVALFIFLLFSNSALLDWYAKKWQPAPQKINSAIVYSCGIIPGGFGSPGPDDNGYFNATSDRFIQALKLYKAGEIKYILISGGNGKKEDKSFREAAWAKGEFISVGVPDSAVFVEDRSNNTMDNAFYAKKILDSLKLKPPYLLITSAYHIPRARLLFENAGVKVDEFPCNYFSGNSRITLSSFIPHFAVLFEWDLYLKEAAGYLYYCSKGKAGT